MLRNLLTKLFGKKIASAYEPSGKDTEAIAEVVRVVALEPHGNADSLEVARIELRGSGLAGYEIIVKKGDYKIGDLAAYFGVDCIVPIEGPFSFLGKRLDGVGKSHYRIRAARLRGRYSQGLLVNVRDCDPFAEKHGVYPGFGQRLWDTMKVTYHSVPEPGTPTQPGKPKKAQPMPIYGVDSYVKNPSIFSDLPEGAKLFVTEKIHGCNFRFGWVPRSFLGIPIGYHFVVGSHRAIKQPGDLGWYGEDVWSEFAKYEDLANRTKACKGHIFYGELYGHTYGGKKIQDLVYGRLPADGPGLVIFDIYNGKVPLEPERRYELAHSLGLPTPPIITGPGGQQTLKQSETERVSLADLAEGYSKIAPAQIREGVVVETVGVTPRRKAKIVGQGYRLRKEA
jgi:RNA ligase (TIGR02306 family)